MAGRLLLALRAWSRVPLAAAAALGRCPRRGCAAAGGGGEPGPQLALGFSEEQARRAAAAEQQLLLLGLSGEAARRALRGCPGLLRLPPAQLEARAGLLRRLGLGRGELPAVLGGCPSLFSLPRRQLEAVVRLLRESCLFTAEQLAEVLRTCPGVLLQDPRHLHHHFQYAYFRMGVQQKAMVKARLFRTPFAELRNRHGFLERLGLYQPPRKGQTPVSTPQLKAILHLPEGDFLASLARSTPEEYEVFKKLLAREEEEEMEEEEEEEEDDRDALYAEGDEDSDSEGAKR